MYHFEITKHKKKEEFVLSLHSTKKAELLFKVEGFETKANAKKLAQKIIGLAEATEVRDLSIPPKVDKTATKQPVAKKQNSKKESKDAI